MKKRPSFFIIIILILIFQSCNENKWSQIGSDILPELKGDFNGYSTAMNADGSIIAVGGPYNDGNGIGSGHVRVFKNEKGKWVQLGDDIDGSMPYEHFGKSIDINKKGNIIAVSLPNANNLAGGEHSGQVRIFKFENGKWIQLGQSLEGECPEDKFGHDISLNNNGNIIAVGVPNNDSACDDCGVVKVYKLTNNQWEPSGNSIFGDRAVSERYLNRDTKRIQHVGTSIDMNGEGNILVIGSTGNSEINENRADFRSWSGSVSVYNLIEGKWTLMGNHIVPTYSDEDYTMGKKVSINEKGNIVVTNLSYSHGSIKVLSFNNNSWQQLGNTINGIDIGYFAEDDFVISAEGNFLLTTSSGMYKENLKDMNFVSLFELTENEWELKDKRIELSKGYNGFPNSISISDNGLTVLIGNSTMDDENFAYGEVKVFKYTPKNKK